MIVYREIRNEKNTLIGYLKLPDNLSFGITPGNMDYEDFVAWQNKGNTPDSDPNVLVSVKTAKITEYKAEGVRRIGLQIPEWNTFERIAFLASIWNMLRTPTATQIKAKDIYLYVKDTAIPDVNSKINVSDVLTIDVATDPGWPV